MLGLRFRGRRPPPHTYLHSPASQRQLLTLAIETSCDDTCVALLDKRHAQNHEKSASAVLYYHEKITSNNVAYRGIHPVVALESHQQNLGQLVQNALRKLPHGSQDLPDAKRFFLDNQNGSSMREKPDFISVTRGPGMRSSLFTGLDMAKGLSMAMQVPLVGVNHMQAHALTPRLVFALDAPGNNSSKPDFPFLSLLVSGGHTMLLESKSLTEHIILARTCDIAIGDAIDKIARLVLPSDVLETSATTMYGPLLEQFAFPNDEADFAGTPSPQAAAPEETTGHWSWTIPLPYSAGAKAKALEYSFSGIDSQVSRIMTAAAQARGMGIEERRAVARRAMRTCFEHLASRVFLALDGPLRLAAIATDEKPPSVLVVSGGVAANKFLRHVLREYLGRHGHPDIELVFPPVSLCTDNAAMIGWAGIEMFEAGWRSDLSIKALRKWSLDPRDADGGILGVPGWVRSSEF